MQAREGLAPTGEGCAGQHSQEIQAGRGCSIVAVRSMHMQDAGWHRLARRWPEGRKKNSCCRATRSRLQGVVLSSPKPRRGACVGADTRPVWHWSTVKFFFFSLFLFLCPAIYKNEARSRARSGKGHVVCFGSKCLAVDLDKGGGNARERKKKATYDMYGVRKTNMQLVLTALRLTRLDACQPISRPFGRIPTGTDEAWEADGRASSDQPICMHVVAFWPLTGRWSSAKLAVFATRPCCSWKLPGSCASRPVRNLSWGCSHRPWWLYSVHTTMASSACVDKAQCSVYYSYGPQVQNKHATRECQVSCEVAPRPNETDQTCISLTIRNDSN